MRRIVIIGLLAVFLTAMGCTQLGMNSVQKTKQLRPGMPYQEVVDLLGEPKSSQIVKGQWIVTWTLHENWKGFVPYNMVFNKGKRLVSWREDKKGYEESQSRWAKVAAALSSSTSGSSGGSGGDPGPSDPKLVQAIAGRWFSFSGGGTISGGSSRNLVLCSNGTYTWGAESSYSTSGGSVAGQSGDSGRWGIQGDMKQGTLTLAASNGSTKRYNYKVCGDGCLYIGGYKYGWARADCR